MRKTSLVILTILLFAVGAGAQDLGTIDPVVQKQIGTTLAGYYGLKDALVDSNVETASQKADELLKALDTVDETKMNDAQKTHWGKLEKLIRTDSVHINRNKEIEHQREHFIKLSNNMYALVFAFKANDTEAYLQYCPMKKASWLSESKEIRNPYYGKKMSACGSVKATLKRN